MINVIGMVYNRPEYFIKQLEYYKRQTVAIKLHTICNNTKLEKFFEDELKKSGLNYNFVKSDNSKKTFIRQDYIRDNLLDTDFLIHVDDDILLSNPEDLENLWNTREKKTMKTLIGKRFTHDMTTFNEENNFRSVSLGNEYDEYSYGALNWGIVDTEFYREKNEMFEIEKINPNFCYEADDLVMSWALNKLGYKIKNHKIFPGEQKHDDKAQWKKIIGLTIDILNDLDKLHKFKRF